MMGFCKAHGEEWSDDDTLAQCLGCAESRYQAESVKAGILCVIHAEGMQTEYGDAESCPECVSEANAPKVLYCGNHTDTVEYLEGSFCPLCPCPDNVVEEIQKDAAFEEDVQTIAADIGRASAFPLPDLADYDGMTYRQWLAGMCASGGDTNPVETSQSHLEEMARDMIKDRIEEENIDKLTGDS